jgi:hypothetical protein
MQSLRPEVEGTRLFPFQGDMVTTLDDLQVNESVMVTEGGQLELAEGDIVAIQLATNNNYLQVVDAETSTLPIDHLVWKQVNQPIADSPKCLFIVEELEGDTFLLCSASTGDYLLVKKDVTTFKDGLIATLTEDINAATRVSMTIVEGNTIRLAGPKRQQLSCVTLDNTDILATRSILPTPQGLFTIVKIE